MTISQDVGAFVNGVVVESFVESVDGVRRRLGSKVASDSETTPEVKLSFHGADEIHVAGSSLSLTVFSCFFFQGWRLMIQLARLGLLAWYSKYTDWF